MLIPLWNGCFATTTGMLRRVAKLKNRMKLLADVRGRAVVNPFRSDSISDRESLGRPHDPQRLAAPDRHAPDFAGIPQDVKENCLASFVFAVKASTCPSLIGPKVLIAWKACSR